MFLRYFSRGWEKSVGGNFRCFSHNWWVPVMIGFIGVLVPKLGAIFVLFPECLSCACCFKYDVNHSIGFSGGGGARISPP